MCRIIFSFDLFCGPKSIYFAKNYEDKVAHSSLLQSTPEGNPDLFSSCVTTGSSGHLLPEAQSDRKSLWSYRRAVDPT